MGETGGVPECIFVPLLLRGGAWRRNSGEGVGTLSSLVCRLDKEGSLVAFAPFCNNWYSIRLPGSQGERALAGHPSCLLGWSGQVFPNRLHDNPPAEGKGGPIATPPPLK